MILILDVRFNVFYTTLAVDDADVEYFLWTINPSNLWTFYLQIRSFSKIIPKFRIRGLLGTVTSLF